MQINKFIVAILMTSSISPAYSDWSDINWQSCGPSGPSGPLNIISYHSNKLKFWVGQYSDIENILIYNIEDYPSKINYCNSKNTGNRTEIVTFSLAENLRINNIKRCLTYARQMCRINGGLC